MRSLKVLFLFDAPVVPQFTVPVEMSKKALADGSKSQAIQDLLNPVQRDVSVIFHVSFNAVFYNGSIIFLEAAAAASVHSFFRSSGFSFILFIETGAIGLPSG